MPKVSQSHLDARRQQILDAAREQFASRGFARTSMTDIVEALGLSVGSIYRYFRSKDEIVIAICEQSSQALPDELTRAGIGHFLESVRAQARDDGHAALIMQIYAEAAVNPTLRQLVSGQLDELRASVESRLPGRDAGGRQEIAETFVALSQGYVGQLAVRGDVDPAPFVDALAALTAS
ncbi:TetR/AcrR family transcriptional regulator [Brachybacterium sp. NBEC-018]|uniref:TetR/AcrR family transcriptional regulator n=1 Tax=Brachybacterium sp. NBEC-018 TaxID=2996004 RepID=UPI00217564BC|nr:TetR/AcrR family transcriptional regulator [Brachybacterium sp. NBEC-018]UVY85553.1 TetR/AcrR family transcriptional regulator [Brachybacterium sp. NBEC-018]